MLKPCPGIHHKILNLDKTSQLSLFEIVPLLLTTVVFLAQTSVAGHHFYISTYWLLLLGINQYWLLFHIFRKVRSIFFVFLDMFYTFLDTENKKCIILGHKVES